MNFTACTFFSLNVRKKSIRLYEEKVELTYNIYHSLSWQLSLHFLSIRSDYYYLCANKLYIMADYSICRLVPRKPFHRITLLIILLTVSATVRSQMINVDGLYYYLADDGGNTCALTGKSANGIHYSGDIKIPASIQYEGKTYEVTEILSAAFNRCKEVTSVEIPSSVRKIGESAFHGCKKLTHITLPNGITTIESNTFGNSGLVSFEVPETVTRIGEGAFADCYDLKSIVIPRSVQSIDEHAFYACIGITSFTLPSSVTRVGEEAFLGCVGLKSFTVEDGNPVYDSRENCNAIIETANNILVRGCQNSIPANITSLDDYAFAGCNAVTTIDVPEGVKIIGESAFYRCDNVRTVSLPSSLEYLRAESFGSCLSLESITIPENVKHIGSGSLINCPSLTSITITAPGWPLGNSVFSYEPDVVLHVIPGLKNGYLDYLRYWEYHNITVVEDASSGIEKTKEVFVLT